MLLLEDLKDMSADELCAHLIEEYRVSTDLLDEYEILLGYESVGSWGCDSSSFFILRKCATGALFEVHGSHCSCYGFEEQFEPEECTRESLLTLDLTYDVLGGYDEDKTGNAAAIKAFIESL